MITPEMSDTIKQIIGHDYAKKILEFLAENHITKPNGKEYLRQDVYHCVNRAEGREYPGLEVAIFDYIAEIKLKEEQELARRKAILK